MDTPSTRRSLHPMLWVAAIAVTVFAIAGIGAITGVIPVAKSEPGASIPQPVASTAEPAPAVAPIAPVTTAPPEPPRVIVKQVEKPIHHHRSELASNDPPPPPGSAPPDYAQPQQAICRDCGRIESVQRIVHQGDGSGAGALAGGALGGIAGHQVGNGNGRTLATIAGAIGGAFLGNHVEKEHKETVSYQTVVRFDDGTSRTFTNVAEPGWREGERVHLVNGEIQPG